MQLNVKVHVAMAAWFAIAADSFGYSGSLQYAVNSRLHFRTFSLDQCDFILDKNSLDFTLFLLINPLQCRIVNL